MACLKKEVRRFLFVCLFFFFGGGGGRGGEVAIQKNLKIRGSACVSWPRSSAKVFFSSLSTVFIFWVISFTM